MARRPTTTQRGNPSVPQEEERTIRVAIAEGHGPNLSRASAQAIADASKAAGFPTPPQAAAVLAQPAEGQEAPEAGALAGDGALNPDAPPAGDDAHPKTEA
jgi:hypothetical protein